MPALDKLPADQRAVLQLVLQRGRSYDDIAEMLSIDRAAVRQRALAALDALGPQTRVPADRRALITDYLLGQLPATVAQTTRARLVQSPTERAWARVVASELMPIAGTLPEIPVDDDRYEDQSSAAPVAADRSARTRERGPREPRTRRREPRAPARPASRRGGAMLLGTGVLLAIVVAVVLIIVLAGGSSPKQTASTTTGPNTLAGTSTATTGTSTTGTSTSTSIVGQINLTSPTTGSQAAGIAEILRQGAKNGVAIVAQHMTPNTKHNAYAVWLYNSPGDAQLLGFVSPGVGTTGRLSTAGPLPTNATHFKNLIVTLETQASPKQPGPIVLQGALTGIP